MSWDAFLWPLCDRPSLWLCFCTAQWKFADRRAPLAGELWRRRGLCLTADRRCRRASRETHAWRSLFREGDFNRIALPEMRQVVAFLGEDMPFAFVGRQKPDIADRIGQLGRAANIVTAANHAHRDPRRAMRSMHAGEIAGV